MSTVRGRFALVAALLATSVAPAACGGDGGDSAGSSSSAVGDAAATQAPTGPEDTVAPGEGADSAGSGSAEDEGSPERHIAPDAEVTAGLGALKGVGDKVASAPSGAASTAAAEALEPVWEPIEGTVKKNEPDLYLDIEDSFQRMESGDLANARRGAQSMATAVDAYLARHPG